MHSLRYGTAPPRCVEGLEYGEGTTLTTPAAQSKSAGRRFGGLTNETYLALRDLIFAGDLRPNDRLVETELAARLNVSRTPVREALQKLCAEGLVVEAPRKGYAVAEFTPEFIVDHYAVREVLEGLAARLAAQSATELEIVQLGAELEAMARASKVNKLEELARHNANFYMLIAKASRNVVLTDLLTVLQDRLRVLRDFNFRVAGRREEALREQRNLLKAIRDRDADKAERVAKMLVRNARQVRLIALRGGA